jgi:hypothetical protein
MPTSGRRVAARQERRRARQACGLLAGPARYAVRGKRRAAGLTGRPGDEAEWPNVEGGSSRPTGQKLRRKNISFSFFISNFPITFSNSF